MIYHLLDGSGEGGAETIASLLAGSSGRLLTLAPAHPDLKKLSRRIRSLDGIPDSLFAPGDRGGVLARRVMWLRRLRGHAIVAHDPASHEAATLARAIGGLPVVRVMHTSAAWTPEDHRRAFHLFSPATSFYFCVERRTHLMAMRLGLRSLILPQPIDLGRLNRRVHMIPRRIRLLFVGRLEQAKGADVLIEAFARVVREVSCELTVIGDGPERPNLESAVQQRRLSGRVSWMGHRRDVGRWYSHADLVVIPSRGEGGSLVALESMACGTPIAGSSVGGLRELMRFWNLSTLMAPSGNAGALSDVIVSFCRSPGYWFDRFERIRPKIAAMHDAGQISKWVNHRIAEYIHGRPGVQRRIK